MSIGTPHITNLLWPLLAAATACAPRSTAPGAVQPASECVLEAAASADSITIALTGTVDPRHAPVPHNDSERLVFRQLYETLLAVDCAGNLLPALAVSWSSAEEGRVWHFRLRTDARFSDGSSIGVSDVLRSWESTPAFAAAIVAVAGSGERELRVQLHEPIADARLFANAALAVARRDSAGGWPLGSGPYRIVDARDLRTLRLLPTRPAEDTPPALTFRTFMGGDARNALDAGVDLHVSADAAVLAYARALPSYRVSVLPWHRTYVLATHAPASSPTTVPPTEALLTLARDAVRGEARPADADALANFACASAAPALRRVSGRTVLYPGGDAMARDVAERLVALAWPVARAPAWLRALLPADYGSGGAPSALALEPRALADSLRARRGLAAIVPVPDVDTQSCAARRLSGDVLTQALNGVPVIPLLQARDHLIHRSGATRLLLFDDGTFRPHPRAP